MKALEFALVLTMAAVTAPGAQAPAAVPPPAPAAPPADLPSPPADYTYSPGGRRDPFTSLTRIGTPITAPTGAIAKSAADLLVDEVSVRGIVLSSGSYVAMVSGPGARQTFTVKAGSRLFDGTVQSITSDAVVFMQQVSDPLSLQKQREVRKLLRTQEEGK